MIREGHALNLPNVHGEPEHSASELAARVGARMRRGAAFAVAALALVAIVGATLIGMTHALAEAPPPDRVILFVQNVLALAILIGGGAFLMRARGSVAAGLRFASMFRLYDALTLVLAALLFAAGFVLFLVSRGVPMDEVLSTHLTRLLAWYALAAVGLAAIVAALALRDGLAAAARRAHRQDLRMERLFERNADLAEELEGLRREAKAGPNWIVVKSVGKVEFVDPAQIIWISSARNYVELHLRGRVVLHRAALKEVLTELEGEGFVQVRRTAAVNVAQVAQFARREGDGAALTLRDGSVVAVGPNFRAGLVAKLEAAQLQA